MSDDAHIGIQVEADATQVTSTANQAAEALSKLLGKVKELETSLKGVFNGKLPANLKQLEEYAKTIEAGPRGRTSRIAEELATGPAAKTRQAVRKIRTSGAVRELQAEKALNQELEARRRIYQNLRRDNPSSTPDQIAEKYRLKLRQLGDEPSTVVRQKKGQNTAKALDAQREEVAASHARMLAELKQFNADTLVEEERALAKKKVLDEKKKAEERRRSPFGRLAQAAGYVADYALVGVGIGAAAKVGGDVVQLEDKMNAIKADSGGTEAQVSSLTKAILDLGTKTRQTNVDLAETADQLLKSGYSFEQAQKMLKPIANLATATGSSSKDSTDSMVTVLKTFDLGADRADKVGNSLVALAQRSRLPIEQVAQGLQSVGNIAHQDGITFDELIATFGQLSQAGIKSGSTMGAGLKTLLTAIENPSKKLQDALSKAGMSVSDIDVKTHGLQGAMENLAKIDFLSALPARAANIAAALVKTKDSFDGIHESILNSNASTQAADIRMQSLGAQTQRLTNSAVSLVFSGTAPLLKVLQGLVGALAAVTEAMSKLGPVIGVVGTALGALTASALIVWLAGTAKTALLASTVFTTLAEGFAVVAAAGGLLEGTMVVLGAAFTFATGPVGILAIAIGVVAGAFALLNYQHDQYVKRADEAKEKTSKLAGELENLKSESGEVTSEITRLNERHDAYVGKAGAVGAETETLIGKFANFGQQIKGNITDINQLIEALGRFSRAQAQAMAEKAVAKIDSLGDQKNAEVGNQSALRQKMMNMASHKMGAGSRNPYASVRDIQEKASKGIALTQADLNRLHDMGLGDSPLANAARDYLGSSEKIGQFNSDISATRANYLTPARVNADAGVAAFKLQIEKQQQQIAAKRKLAPLRGPGAVKANDEIRAMQDGFASANVTQANQIAGRLGPTNGGTDAVLGVLNGFTPRAVAPGQETKKQFSDRITNLKNAKKYDEAEKAELANATSDEDIQNIHDKYDNLRAKAGRGKASKGAHNEAATDKFDLQDLDRTIAGKVAQGGQDISADLAERGEKQRAQMREGWKGKGFSRDQMDRQMASLDSKISDYTIKMLSGNIAGAKAIIAKQASDKSTDTVGVLQAQLSSGNGDLAKAQQSIHDSVFGKVIAQINYENEQFKASTQTDPATAQSMIAKRAELVRAGVAEVFAAQEEAIRNASMGEQFKHDIARQGAERKDASKRSQLEAFKNNRGVQNIGGVHDWIADQALQQLDIKGARRTVDEAQFKNNVANTNVASFQRIADAAKGGVGEAKALKDLQDARVAAEATNKALKEANDNLVKIDGSSQSFANYSEAAAAAWKQFSTEAKLNMPMTERFADGLHDALTAANGGMNKFFQDMISGTVKGKQAFASLGIAILQAIANKAIAAAVDMLFNFVGGMGKGVPKSMIGLGGFGMKQGGEVRRMAQGGEVGAMNRDSVPILAEPGEVMMNKTAVDFIGKSNLLSMNTMGNRRISGVSSAARQAKREPDVVNTYIVAPGQQPSMTAKDVIVAVTQDMLSNGQTKKLVRAIAIGNA
jgi:TP901 family phage tail tape measure protein